MASKYEYAVRRTELNSGKIIYTPVCREKSKLIKNKWTRIVNIYDKYLIMELDWEPEGLTVIQCKEHILKHKEQVQMLKSNEVLNISIEVE